MKKKRGFTLIELLAVIVILAIIALIATPIVMNVIENSKKGAAERSAENYLRAVETAIATERLDGPVEDGIYVVNSDGNIIYNGNTISVDVNGTKPKENSSMEIKAGQINIESITLYIGDYTVSDTNNDGKLDAVKTKVGEVANTVAERSASGYLSAVEAKIADGTIKDGTYKINADGKLQLKNDSSVVIVINITGTKPTSGIITIKDGVVEITNLEVNDIYIIVVNNKPQAVDASTLVSGQDFNAKIKTLSSGKEATYSKLDSSIKSVEFYSNGDLPEGYTKEQLESLPNISVSDDNKIIAYKDISNIYIYSDNQILFNEDASYMFSNLIALTKLGWGKANTSNMKNTDYMFKSNNSLESLNLIELDTSNVTSMKYMFANYDSNTALDFNGFDTSNVTNMSYMFTGYNSNAVLDLSKLNTTNVTNMSYMFASYNSNAVLDLSKLNTTNVTNMSYMFNSYKSNAVLDLNKLNTTNVTNMSNMFSNYSSSAQLDLSKLNTNNVTNMFEMFNNFNSETITSLDLTNFDTNKVTNMNRMFRNASKITEIKVTEGKWKTPKYNTTDMFTGCGTDHVTEVPAT